MQDYQSAYAAFDRALAGSALDGWREGRLNAAIECCDRHCGVDRVALRHVGREGACTTYSFEELRDASIRVANVLRGLGIGRGDRVAALLPRGFDLLSVVIGTWRIGAVFQPLFTAFGPKAIEHRLETSSAKLVITDAANRPKLDNLSVATRIATVGASSTGRDIHLTNAMQSASLRCPAVVIGPDDPFLIMFTSGTTGLAKPLLVPIKAIAAFAGYMRDAVGLVAEDQFWNIADPGWAYGLYYGIAGPLALGHAILFDERPFSVDATLMLIHDMGITNLTGSPTAFRAIMAAGDAGATVVKGHLRAVSCAGEPLNPEVIRWFADTLGVTVHDHYGQTELGMVVCNHHRLSHAVTPGAAGHAVPGHRVVVLDDNDCELPPGKPGTLAIDRHHSPLFWFTGYDGHPPLLGRYYRSGDTVSTLADGSIGFVGRADDVITSSGYRIGPFDVESALIEHGAVAEAAVIGKPDPKRTEIVKAFVVLRSGHIASPDLDEALRRHVRERLSAHAYPREIAFVDSLPRTPSGKIQRHVLREWERMK